MYGLMQKLLSKLFSCSKDEVHVIYRFLGIKITKKNPELTLKPLKTQNLYDIEKLKSAKKIIVFLVPNTKIINGEIQSIFSICKYSREICSESLCLISTIPGKYTYSENNLFKNDEKIYRWEQIVKNAQTIAHDRYAMIEKLEKELPDFKLITVNKMTFDEYMDLIAKSYLVITFGEGMDGYFIQPQFVGSIGFAVYNESFSPNESWKDLRNIYKNYEEIEEVIVADMVNLLENKEEYGSTIESLKSEIDELYSFDKFQENLRKFYKKEYTFN